MFQNIIVVQVAIKYNPPSLFLIYRYHQRDKKLRRYRIELNSLAFLPSADAITDQLYVEHQDYLNDENVEYSQIHKLVEMLYENQQKKSGTRRSVIKNLDNLDEVNSVVQSEDELNKSIYQDEEDWQTPPNRRTETIYPKDNNKFKQTAGSNDSMSLSISGMQNFMQTQQQTKKTYLPIQSFDEANPKNRKFVEDQIQQNQNSYFKNKYIPLPEPLINRNNQKINNYY